MTQAPAWNVSGDYYETCNCDYVCPCVPGNLAGKHTKGDCVFVMVFHVNQGRHGNVSLDGLNWVAIGRAPGPTMADGNIAVGLIVDERASQAQRDALTQIGSGQGGGPMAALGPLVSSFLGVEAGAFAITKEGLKWSTRVGAAVDQAGEGMPGANQDEPLYIDNCLHPASTRLALGKATRSRLHAFGLDWEDTSGQNNAHYAPFRWQS